MIDTLKTEEAFWPIVINVMLVFYVLDAKLELAGKIRAFGSQ